MKNSVFLLVLACIGIMVGCCPTKPMGEKVQETTAIQRAYTEHTEKTKAEKTIPWVCYDCGHEGNTAEVCAVCGVKPNAAVTADGVIEIVFPENPSTGFLWSCIVTPQGAVKEDSGFQSDMSPEEQNSPNPPDGVGGSRTYRFRPVKDGKVTLCFTLARSPDEINRECLYTYAIKNGVPARVAGARNTWVCDCGSTHNRVEQVCYTCERAMPGLEDGWFCNGCWRCHTKDEANCPNCGEARSYENEWVCACGYVVSGGYDKSCARCDTVPPTYAGGWVCAVCNSVNPAVKLCEFCEEPNDYSGDAWICACRHLNNWSTPQEEWSDVCARCGKPRPDMSR